jgi:hypothetical protein
LMCVCGCGCGCGGVGISKAVLVGARTRLRTEGWREESDVWCLFEGASSEDASTQHTAPSPLLHPKPNLFHPSLTLNPMGAAHDEQGPSQG